MTPTQLTHLEAELERRGYKLWTTRLIGNEDRAWHKRFGIHEDKYGDTECDYLIAFRVTDWRDKDFSSYPEQSAVWITVSMLPTLRHTRIDCDWTMQVEVPDIDLCEKMFKDMFEVIRKYKL